MLHPPPPPDAAAGGPSSSPHDRAILLVADTIGDLMGFWNFKPSMGRVWAVLYLSRDALTAEQIELRTGLSAGAVSMTVTELLQWGVVRRAWSPGERKRHFEAETDIVSLITRVFRERELRLIDESIGRLREAVRLLEDSGSSVPDQMFEGRFLLTRVRRLLELAEGGRALVDRLVRAGSLDLGLLRGALIARGG